MHLTLLYLYTVIYAKYVLNNKGLTSIPSNIGVTETYVDLQRNTISSINITNLAAFTRLTNFYIAYNKVTHVAPDAFINNPLTVLVLSYNPLVEAPNLTAVRNTLQTLHLANCSLSQLQPGYFEGFDSLKILVLNYNDFVTLEDCV